MNTINFQTRLPKSYDNSSNEKEHFFLTQNGQERKILLHDYTEMYQNPGLYEHICYQHLDYQSPRMLSAFLIEQVVRTKQAVAELKMLELAAGSGLTAREFVASGVKSITGIDNNSAAAEAAKRESAGIYEDYYVEDLTRIKPETEQSLKNKSFNCLICCSALPALPADVFVNALNLIRPNAWMAFNVLKDIWEDTGSAGFVNLHPWVNNHEIFEIREQRFFRRRYTTYGRPLEDVAIVGIKKNPDVIEVS